MKTYLLCSLILMALTINEAIAAGKTIAIDAGHSRQQPGATSASGEPEFNFNATLARTVSDFLTASGIPVLRIGHDGNMASLKKRTAIANNADASFFLSIHHDSVQPQYLKQWESHGTIKQYTDYAAGFSLFVSRKNSSLPASLQCASAIGAALKAQGLRSSPHHAENIPGESKEWADKENGVYYYDDLIVLKTAEMPAVLLEAGVIVNREEEQAVQTPEMRNTIAAAIETGLLNCGVIH